MRKFCALFKVNFRAMLYGSTMMKAGKKRAATGIGAIFLISMVMLYISGMYSFMLASALAPINGLPVMLTLMMSLAALMMVFLTINSAQGVMFGGKDSDLIFSLPVHAFWIMLSKISAVYIENLLICFFAIGPAAVIYVGFGGNAGVMFWVMLGMGMLFFPLLPTLLSLILGFVLSFLSSHTTHKTFFTNVLSIVGFVALMAGIMSMNMKFDTLFQNIEGIQRNLSIWLYPIAMFQRAVCNVDFGAMARFVFWSIAPFFIVVYLFSKGYQTILSRLQNQKTQKNYQLGQIQRSTRFSSLYKKEARLYFGTSIYLFNTFVGIVMLVGFSLYAAISKGKIADIVAMFPFGGEAILPILIAGVSFMLLTVATTAVSISLEGRKLWILKEAPIPPMAIFHAKIGFNLSLTIPTLCITVVLLTYAFSLQPIQMLMLFLFPALFSACCASMGLLINLFFPKLDAINDTMVVKQSLSSMLGFFVPMALMGGMAVLYGALLAPHLSFSAFYATCCLIFFLLLGGIHRILATKGVQLFEKLM